MALTNDQKKHLLIGGGIGALALFLGTALFGGGRSAAAAPAFAQPRQLTAPARDHRKRQKRHRDQHDDNDRGEYSNDRGEYSNDRGEYGKKKHKHKHKRHRHDD